MFLPFIRSEYSNQHLSNAVLKLKKTQTRVLVRLYSLDLLPTVATLTRALACKAYAHTHTNRENFF